ncbi:hypothetical protein PHMEG_0006478 [Phytophthora megakarya]|uniref:RNase H type-1 domain-containing protein n=1 Tax=Phytophthora megakarya TaxID=4795 RepID=A0A225WNP7_9STRA|nr:hypothetical protein PHMEG_0006478 [Phytophthora megakarya]
MVYQHASKPKRVTNNVADNITLLLRLRSCQNHRWTPLHVISDSALIFRQQQTRTSPLTANLKPCIGRTTLKYATSEIGHWLGQNIDEANSEAREGNV